MESLKSVGEAIEYGRRLRRDLPDGPHREAVDASLVRMVQHLEALIGEDDRLARRRDAEREARATIPRSTTWAKAQLDGSADRVIARIIDGMEPRTAWSAAFQA